MRYRLAHVVNDIGDGTAEFYYNVVDPSNGFPQQNVSATVTGPVAATRAACFYGDLGSTTQCEAVAGTTSTFAVPDLEAEQGASVLTSYPRDAFGDLTPDLREGSADAGSGAVVSPGLARALGWLTIGLAVLVPLLAGALMGLLVWSRGRDEQYAGLTPGLTPGVDQQVPVVVGGPQPRPSPCSSPRRRACSPAWSARSSTRRSTSSTSPRPSSTSPCAATCRSPATTRASSGPTTGCSPAPRRRPPRPRWRPTSSCSSTRSSSGGDRIALSQLKNHFKPTLDAVERLMYDEVVQRGWFRRSPERQRSGWVGFGTFVLAGVGCCSPSSAPARCPRSTRTPASRSTRPGCSWPAGWSRVC